MARVSYGRAHGNSSGSLSAPTMGRGDLSSLDFPRSYVIPGSGLGAVAFVSQAENETLMNNSSALIGFCGYCRVCHVTHVECITKEKLLPGPSPSRARGGELSRGTLPERGERKFN